MLQRHHFPHSFSALASDDFLCHLLEKKLNIKEERKWSERVCVRMKEREGKTCQSRLQNKNVLEINYSLSVSRQPPTPLISQLLQARKKRGKKKSQVTTWILTMMSSPELSSLSHHPPAFSTSACEFGSKRVGATSNLDRQLFPPHTHCSKYKSCNSRYDLRNRNTHTHRNVNYQLLFGSWKLVVW